MPFVCYWYDTPYQRHIFIISKTSKNPCGVQEMKFCTHSVFTIVINSCPAEKLYLLLGSPTVPLVGVICMRMRVRGCGA